MEVQEEAITMEVEAMTTKEEDYDDDHHHQPTRAAQMMIKGKRTKRQRPQSPIPFLQVPTVNSSSATGDCGGGLGLDPPANMSPPANSWDFPATCSATEEEEDMANCLILLAQGQSREPPPPPVQDDNRNNNVVAGVYNCKVPARSSSSKLGVYVYECKTCSRTFPSFQALGGHRASHKKPKLAATAEEKRRLQQRSAADKEYFGQFKSSNVNTPHSLSLQLSSRAMHACNNNNNNNNNNRSKLHECSICGAEFSSGQALGGHMRRHRGMAPPTNAAASATTLSLMSPMALDDHQTVEELITISNDNKNDDYKKDSSNMNGVNGGAGGLSLSLDLNLPAPDDERETNKFGFPSKQQPEQSHLVFSTPTLVDCQH